jgi:malate dehydrogenase (oxaloacetate-decarboxylating)
VKVAGKRLRDQQIVMLGAGSASIGVADYLREAMVADGITMQEALSRIWIVNRNGVLHDGRQDLSSEQRLYAQPASHVAAWPRTANGKTGLADVIAQVDATILIGLSTLGGAFTEPIVREMARKTARPIIFPLSNPTTNSEATAEDLIRWTDGRALVASGSPFAPVEHGGRRIPIAQCNNVYIFPALGMGLIASGARRVTDSMIIAAAKTLAEHSPARNDVNASLLPALTDLRSTVAIEIAVAVGLEAQRAGVAPETTPEEMRERVLAHQWNPVYKDVLVK